MTHTLRQPAHAAVAACASLALLLGACAPATPQAESHADQHVNQHTDRNGRMPRIPPQGSGGGSRASARRKHRPSVLFLLFAR